MDTGNDLFKKQGRGTRMWRQVFFAAFLSLSLCLSAQTTVASYAVYVDDGAEDDGDGSKEKPFKKITDAMEEAKSGETVYIANGSYSGGFTVPSSVGLYGESRDGVVIAGSVNAQSGTSFNNLTIAGSHTALTVKPNSTVTVKKCTIKNALKMGINIEPGNGKLTIENSKIQSNGKGIYVQRGNELRLSGSTISKNKEEGVDIRSKVDGSVKGNEITNNGESGVELILGSSDLSIADNTISNNSASGIATQFYADFSKKGKVKIDGNRIKSNNHYGVKCGTPSGGDTPSGYWEKSLNLNDNTFGGNDEGDIAGRCKITLDDESDESVKVTAAVAEKVVAENITEEAAEQKEEDAEATVAEENQDALAAEELTYAIKNEAGLAKIAFEEARGRIETESPRLKKRYTFRYMVWGPDKKVLLDAENDLALCKEKLTRLKELAGAATDGQINAELNGSAELLAEYVTQKEPIIAKAKENQNFWYRLKDMLAMK